MREVTRGGFTWKVTGPETHAAFWDEWEAGEWECDTLEIVKGFVKPGTTFIDIGAWIGPVSLWAMEFGAGRVIAIEPDPVALEHLHFNLGENANGRAFQVVPYAVSDHTSIEHLAAHRGWGSTMSYLTLPDNPEAIQVPSVTVPDLFLSLIMPNEPVSLVKMDIEGAEGRVLETAAPYLAERGIPLVVSIHPQWLTKPIQREWFDGYRVVLENMGHLRDMTICIP